MEQFKIIDITALYIFLHSHFCGLHMAVLLLQGNDMLKSSLYTSFFVIVSAYCLFFSSLRVKVQNRVDFFVELWLIFLRIAIVILAAFYLKKLISNFLEVQEDSHVWDILYSKFTNFKSFHTLIYTCAVVFDFLPWSSIKKLFKSFLIPFAILSILNVCNRWITDAVESCSKEIEERMPTPEKDDNSSDESDSGVENSDSKRQEKTVTDLDLIDKEIKSKLECKDGNDDVFLMFLRHFKAEPAIFYNISQMVVFGVMAALIMRLKFLFTTQLCIVSSLMMNTSYYA